MKTQSFPYAFFQGKIVPVEDAKVSIMTNALQYGTALFGGIRGYVSQNPSPNGRWVNIFRLTDHIQRFFTQINILGCSISYSKEELKSQAIELIKKNQPSTDFYLRLFAYVGSTELGPNLANTILDFSLYMIPLGEYLPMSKGLSLMVSSWRRVSDNAIPSRGKISGAYVNSALARKEATENGFDEAIFLNDSGHVCEGSAENIFIVKDGVLITPTVSEGILEGITRKSILQIARNLNIPVETRPIDRSELYVCDEAFLSGTACQIAWIEKIDKRNIGDGKKGNITSVLQNKFFNIVQGKDEQFKDWCTKIEIK